jgi:hypothetical protein
MRVIENTIAESSQSPVRELLRDVHTAIINIAPERKLKGQVFYRENLRDGKLKGQVFYRDPWGNRPFRIHPVRSSGSVAPRLALLTGLSAPRANRSTRIPRSGRTFVMRLHALSRSR